MAAVGRRNREGHRRLLILKSSRQDQRCKRWGIWLKLRGVLAQREEWTRWGMVVPVEEVVDKVRGKRNQVDEEESRRQRADGLPSPWPLVSPSPDAHSEPTVSD